jgi:hypothetical protein
MASCSSSSRRILLDPELGPPTDRRAEEDGGLKRLMQRYLIASAAFAVAALILGVGLARGLECLVAFALTSLVVNGVQRRQMVNERSRVGRSDADRSRGRTPTRSAERSRKSAGRSPSHPRTRGTQGDDTRSGDWPQLADYGW